MYKNYTNKLRVPNRHVVKLWLIMRLTIVILIASLLQVSAASFGQKITLSAKNATLAQVFDQIKSQSGIDFLVSSQILKSAKKVSINVTNTELKDVLNEILSDQPLEYTIEDKFIVVSRKEKPSMSLIEKINLYFAEITVSGIVIDENGIPLDGAIVKVKDGKAFTRTTKEGTFKLAGVDEKATLVISFLGYANKEVQAAASLGIIRLAVSDNPLDAVRIIGYGTDSKRFAVGNVATVTSETIKNQPVTNVLLALQGQVAGLNITTQNGVPGARVYVQLRGQNTIGTGTANANKPYDQPLFIVDGIPFARQNNNINMLYSQANTSQAGGGLDQAGGLSPFSSINPNDIESISILKDADATSIYGSEGSNGVILITTKRGRAGKTVLNTSINTQFNSGTREVKLLNTEQYIKFRADAFAADGIIPTVALAPDLLLYDQIKYTNWADEIYGKGSKNTVVNSSLSGGSGSNTFLISTGFSQSGVNYPGNYSNKQFTLHSQFNTSSNDKRLDLAFIADYGYGTNNSPGSPGNASIGLPPNTPDLLNADGSLIWFYKGLNLGNQNVQFYSYLNQFFKLQNHNFQTSMRLNYKIYKGLTFSTNIGYNRNNSIESGGNPTTARFPGSTTLSTASFANSIAQTINIEPQLNYRATIGRGSFTALLGGTYKKNTGSTFNLNGSGYNNDNLLGSANGAATKTSTDGNSIRKYAALFGRLNYIYASKYIISLTGRRDGSSNFGPDQQFGNFGSVGGGWIFSEEEIVKKVAPFMSYGKLSTSYGTSGSDGVGQYLYQTFWGVGALTLPTFQGTVATFPQNHYNPIYSWSLKKSLNMAADLGFFKDRILANVTYYRNRESNQLGAFPLPIQTGFSTVTRNLSAIVQNKGWEFGLNTKNIQTKSFTWESNFNLSFNRNKLLSFENLATSPYRNAYKIGEPISVVYGLKFAGIDPATGLPQYYDTDGTVTKTPVGGNVPIANREVDYSGGFGNRLSYKQFRLDFFLQFSSQTAPNYLKTLFSSTRPGINQQNIPAAFLDNYWRNPGDIAKTPKLTSTNSSAVAQSFGNLSTSDAFYEKNRYLRLKTVSLAYNLPESMIKKVGMKSGSINLNAQNLFTLTNVKVGDPESNGNYLALPLQRIISLGANFNF